MKIYYFRAVYSESQKFRTQSTDKHFQLDASRLVVKMPIMAIENNVSILVM